MSTLEKLWLLTQASAMVAAIGFFSVLTLSAIESIILFLKGED